MGKFVFRSWFFDILSSMDNLVTRALFVLFVVSVCCRSAPLENSTENLGELINTEKLNDCDCNWRYLKHYDARQCLVIKADDCGCPISYICPNNKPTEEPITGCKYENKLYPVGSKIITADNCQVCRCINKENPKIQCVTKECPLIDVPIQHNCHLLYKKNKCCPVGFKCISDEEEENITHQCEFNNKLYPVGSKIYSEDDPCLVCDCTEDWSGISNSSCRRHDCLFEKNRHLMDAGCIPVYHESRCCPIEFYCPHNDLAYFSPANASEENITVEFDSQCLFAGQLYPRGAELPVNNSCVECKCVTPPDFTCIHMSCPLPPNAENCYAKRTPGNCCPSYECLYGDESLSGDEIETNRTICPTPQCADSSCRIEIPPDSECPTCICNSSDSSIERNELQPVRANFEDMEAKMVENDGENDQDFEKLGNKLETSENDIPEFEKMIQEQPINENSEVNNVTELEETSLEENNFNPESVSAICPTPQCADSSCHIEIPSDGKCPTCICNSSDSSIERNELQPVSASFEDMEAKMVENDGENDQDFEKLGDKLEASQNDIPEFEKMIQEQPINENSEVNDVTDLEKTSLGENNFRPESAPDSEEVTERVIIQEATNNDENGDMDREFNAETESFDAESQRNMHKRSQGMNQLQQQESVFSQGETQFSDLEREGGVSQGGDEYDDEIQSFKGKKPELSGKTKNGLSSGKENGSTNTEVEVPPGCPTPMCESSNCRIGMPPGHRCPTCVCYGTEDRQP